MAQTLTIGRRLVPADHIALLEPYERRESSSFHPTRDFQARVVLLNRDSLLIEEPVEAFATRYGFSLLPDERVAVNPLIRFAVETFSPAEGFTPSRPYVTRLKWRDADDNDQSKLLLTDPETVLAIAVMRDVKPAINSGAGKPVAGRSPRQRRRPRSTAAATI